MRVRGFLVYPRGALDLEAPEAPARACGRVVFVGEHEPQLLRVVQPLQAFMHALEDLCQREQVRRVGVQSVLPFV
ncbi:hypothetical protein Csp2054_05545 [Curtobacterium sp. 'Ferrero']|nr:hypothetical protein Csp2054_05545 [Curtobacterium sp. 'Ferrero']